MNATTTRRELSRSMNRIVRGEAISASVSTKPGVAESKKSSIQTGHVAFFISAEDFTANKPAPGRRRDIADVVMVQKPSELSPRTTEVVATATAANRRKGPFQLIEANGFPK
jgi:hypothetical protein